MMHQSTRHMENQEAQSAYLSYKHVHTVFEGEAAMAAENARIEAEGRELIKKRPYGPWLFR
jgi:hypothetical protein